MQTIKQLTKPISSEPLKEALLQQMIQAAQALQNNPMLAAESNQLTQELDFDNSESEDTGQTDWWQSVG